MFPHDWRIEGHTIIKWLNRIHSTASMGLALCDSAYLSCMIEEIILLPVSHIVLQCILIVDVKKAHICNEHTSTSRNASMQFSS